MGNNEALKKAKEEWNDIQKDEYEQRMAESRMIHMMDIQSIEETYYEKGEREKAKKIARKLSENY